MGSCQFRPQCPPLTVSPLFSFPAPPLLLHFLCSLFPTDILSSLSLSRSVSLQFPWWAISQMRSCSMCRLRMVAAVAASRQTHPSIRCSATKWDALSAAAVASGVNSIHKVNRDRWMRWRWIVQNLPDNTCGEYFWQRLKECLQNCFVLKILEKIFVYSSKRG